MKLVLANCSKFSREDVVMISFDSEFHSFGTVAENYLSKRDVLDLGTDREPFVNERKLRLLVSNVGLNRFEMYSGVGSFNALKVRTALL